MLRYINFRALIIGSGISEGTTQLLYSITTIVAALTITDQPFLISLIIASRYLPYVLFSFDAGSLAERGDIRKIIGYSLLARFTLVTLIAILFFFGSLNIFSLVIITFLISTARIYGDSAISISYVRYTEKKRWTRIGAQIDLAGNTLEAIMTAVAGTIFMLLGGTHSFTLVALLLIITWLSMLPTIIHLQPPNPSNKSTRSAKLHSLKDAWGIFSQSSILRRLCLSLALQNSALICVQSMLLIFILSTGTSTYWATVISATFAIGLIVGSAASPRVIGKFRAGNVILASTAISTICVCGIYSAVNFSNIIACIATCSYGASVSLGNIAQRRFRQEIIPMDIIGRVGALFGIAIMGAMPIASIISGIVAQHFGYLILFLLAGAMLLVSLLVIFRDYQAINRVGILA
ncbi:MFS transporter [Jonesia quinghaiensis]|uniref:MFS transporter n=1 Tax=Jonesia quinghaiensis TaxID=262806 RepID=UPI00048B59AC|nr:MFS transporter [Jonesia quinghaiensis]